MNYTNRHYIRQQWLLSHIYMPEFAAFPSSLSNYPARNVQACWSLSQLSKGEGGVTQWINHQFIGASQKGKQPSACRNVVLLIILISCLQKVKKKSTWTETMQTHTHTYPTSKWTLRESNPHLLALCTSCTGNYSKYKFVAQSEDQN